MKKLLLILLCLPLIGFGQQTFNFMHNGLNREYIYYAPVNLPVDAPLVFVAHGFTGSAQGIMNYCGMNTIADQNSFAVCYPQGTTDSWGDNFWNVGYNFHAGVTVDDVDFIVSLASHLQSTYQLNTTNTFFTGMSNGGELSYLLACESQNIFRAFAPVAGTIFPNGLTNNICSPTVPVPIFATHGRNDNVTLIEGDPFDTYWGPYLSVDTIINFWVDQNSLTNLVIDTFPNFNNPNKITISYKYSAPNSDNEVWLYTHKSGHNWGDDGDMVIEQEIWDFFSQMSFTGNGYGCTNPSAFNYDPTATIDDGSCCYVTGCTDPNAVNYNSVACYNDGSCMYPVYGCTDPNAANYDPSATNDDGSCCYGSILLYIEILTDNYSYETSWQLVNQSGAVVESINAGDLTSNATNYSWSVCVNSNECYDFIIYDTYGDGICCDWGNGSYLVSYNGTVVASGGSFSSSETTLNIVCGANVNGCTDPSACNYDASATVDNGSCNTAYGCMDSLAYNYDASATCDDSSCISVLLGCTDATAFNYNSAANTDDGSCIYPPTSCNGTDITGLFVSGIINNRAVVNFDNMNTYNANGAQICRVDMIRIKYRALGSSSWSQKNIASPTGYDPTTDICNSTQKTEKNIYNLNPATEYEWKVKLWYCDASATSWVVGPNFTTLEDCPNVGNLSVYGATTTKATFDWDDTNGEYEFVRIKMRVDSISNPQGSDWFNVGGSGVSYPIFTKNKSGLVPGETYRGQARTWCDPNGGAYKSLSWTPLATWIQPTSNRIYGSEAITNLTIYPNPSRDIFNVSFTSEEIQDLRVRVLNVIGEELIAEELQQFVGEYIKQISLSDNAKGIYLLEIETNEGVINKKLILQ